MNFLSDPVTFIGTWLSNLLLSLGLSQPLVTVIIKFIGAGLVGVIGFSLVIFTIWLERKLYARIQDRLGPNRVGPWGIFQTIPDIIKIFTKEYITPEGADKVTYNLAPILMVSAVLLIWAVLPFAPTIVGTDVNVGALYLIAVGAIGALGIILAGWSSNNKYSLLGAFRAVAQMVSYEIPMVLAILVPVLLGRTMGLNSLVNAQSVWFVFLSPIAAFIFFTSSIAETGRAPFDLLEAESEIVAGYQTEYSGLKFGMFYVGEFLHAFTISALTATLFLGGWRGPFATQFPILGVAWFFIKAFIVYFAVVLIRITMPRLRIDQMLNFNWKFLTPLALILLIITAVVDKVFYLLIPGINISQALIPFIRAGVHLLANIIIIFITVLLLKSHRIQGIQVVGKPRPVAVAPEPPASVIS
ncbi:MAG TPA: NADH-quinone oxidoreductase subunit NuoH [Anaerolineales bacterium]|nr:NADH-quinone oxidoreductase subunit NuoH [Anaerolineales bacterium]